MTQSEPAPCIGAVWYTDTTVSWIRHTAGGRRRIESADAPWEFWIDTGAMDPRSVVNRIVAPMEREGARTAVEDGYVRVSVPPARQRGMRRRDRRDALVAFAKRRFGADAVCEADVDPARRWLIDSGAAVATTLSLAYIDIEAQSPGLGIDDAAAGRSRILSYAVVASDGKRYAEVLLAGDRRHADEIPPAEIDVAERALVHRMLQVIGRYDVLVAWNGGDVRPGQGFDFDCIRNRCERLNLQPGAMFSTDPDRPRSGVSWSSVIWLDQLAVYKKYGARDGSMALGAVAERLGLPIQKMDLEMRGLHAYWAAGPENRARILEYNERDTELLPMIEDATGYLSLHLEVCRLCNQVPHTRALKATGQADGFMLRFSGRRGRRWPTCWWDDDPPDDEVEGAFVFDPMIGLRQYVSVADFASLYPSIIRSWNIGPDTVFPSADAVPAGVPFCRAPLIDAVFRTDCDGHFRLALAALVENRSRYKDALRDLVPGTPEYARMQALSQAAKIVANSFYGVLLCKWSRFYDSRAGHAVTSTGQWLIQTAAAELEGAEPGWRIVGGDTDSVFLETPDDPISPRGSDDPLSSTGHRLEAAIATINSAWPRRLADLGCDSSYVELDWEQTFARTVFLKKKMYVGTSHWIGGRRPAKPWKHKYRGIAVRRGDRIAIAKQAQAEAIEMLLGSESAAELPPIPTPGQIQAFVEGWRIRTIEGDVTLSDVVLRQGLKKPIDEYRLGAAYTSPRCSDCRYVFPTAQDGLGPSECPRCGAERRRKPPPAHVRVAEEMRARGETPLPGNKISYVYIYDPDVDRDGWVPVLAEEADMSKLDRAQCWHAVYSGIHAIAEVVFPECQWPSPDAERSRERREARQRLSVSRAGTGGLFDLLDDPGLLC